ERHHGDEQQGREAAQAGAGRGDAVGGVSAREVGMRPRGRLAGGGAGAVFATRPGRLAGAKWARRLPGGVSRGSGLTCTLAWAEPVVQPFARAGESGPARAACGRALSSAVKATCANLGEGVATLRRRL